MFERRLQLNKRGKRNFRAVRTNIKPLQLLKTEQGTIKKDIFTILADGIEPSQNLIVFGIQFNFV